MHIDLKTGWHWFAIILLLARPSNYLRAEEEGWIDLSGSKNFEAWSAPVGKWFEAGGVEIDPQNPKLLLAKPGSGILVNGPRGRTNNLISKQKFGAIEAHVEFMIPQSSNSGVKLAGLYEIQILDTWGVKNPAGSDCGGVYPRAEQKPSYHYLDKGVPPRTNAARPAGEWQTLDVIFLAPRFDENNKKTANARFVKVILNGTTIHEDVELKTPTGSAWHDKEVAAGPLLLQADHGPVAFRNVRVRPYRQE